MAHVDTHLTEKVEIDAIRIDTQDALEVVRQDNLLSVRNSRVDQEPPRWEIAFPTVHIEGGTTDAYESVKQMWRDTERGLHTFNFRCFVDGLVHKVRFDSEMQTFAPAGHLRKIETLTIVEDQ